VFVHSRDHRKNCPCSAVELAETVLGLSAEDLLVARPLAHREETLVVEAVECGLADVQGDLHEEMSVRHYWVLQRWS
jgi:hypothetical protein